MIALGLAVGCSGGGEESSGGGTGGGSGGGGQGGGKGSPLQIEPLIVVVNDSADTRTDTLLASVPFPEGMVTDLGDYGISGRATAWMPLQHWPDGSVKVAQAQFTDDFEGNARVEYEVVKDVTPLSGPFEPNDWMDRLGEDIRFRVRVRDTRDKRYEAEVALGTGGRVVHQTPLVRTRHWRVYHEPAESGSIGRDYLTSQFYVTEYRDVPFVTVDWILGNDYLGADEPRTNSDPNLFPLGAVDVNEATVMFRGADEWTPYLPDLHEIEKPTTSGGWTEFRVMRDTWMDDGQTRRYRFFGRVEDSNASGEVKERWTRSFAARVATPFRPLADLDTWQKSQALGLHGGPVNPPEHAGDLAVDELDGWLARDHFGTWGSFGDVTYSGTSGTPRNTPLSPEAGHAIQAGWPRLLLVLEQKAWAQAMRPYHLFGLEVGAEQDLLLYYPIPYKPGSPDISDESLGRRSLWQNDPYAHVRTRPDYRSHGWNGYDDQHWTTDLLFDYWTLTGDHWAREELRQLGHSLKGAMRIHKYATRNIRVARSEGWTMVGFVQAYLATGDDSIKEYALRRAREVVEVQRLKDHPSRCIRAGGPDPRSGMGDDVTFFPPWEHASIMLGYIAAAKYFEAPDVLRIAEDVVYAIEYSWISDYRHPVTGRWYEDAIRYWTPLFKAGQPIPADYFDDDPTRGAYIPSYPLGSVNQMLVAGLHVLLLHSEDPDVLAKAEWQAEKLRLGGLTDEMRWNKWYLVVPQDYLPRGQ